MENRSLLVCWVGFLCSCWKAICALGICQPCVSLQQVAAWVSRAGWRLMGRLPFQVTNKQRREQQRLEKKKRQEERHRHKALGSRSSHKENNRSEADANVQVTLVKTFAALSIWLWPAARCEKWGEDGGLRMAFPGGRPYETRPTESAHELAHSVSFRLPPCCSEFGGCFILWKCSEAIHVP